MKNYLVTKIEELDLKTGGEISNKLNLILKKFADKNIEEGKKKFFVDISNIKEIIDPKNIQNVKIKDISV